MKAMTKRAIAVVAGVGFVFTLLAAAAVAHAHSPTAAAPVSPGSSPPAGTSPTAPGGNSPTGPGGPEPTPAPPGAGDVSCDQGQHKDVGLCLGHDGDSGLHLGWTKDAHDLGLYGLRGNSGQ